MKRVAALVTLALLAGCGADAPPFVPVANIGASITPSGISPAASLGATNGMISVGLNL